LWSGMMILGTIGPLLLYSASLRGKASAHGTARRAQLGVVNKTQTLEVTSMERTGEVYRVTLRNNSAKTVTDYAYSVGPAISDLPAVPGHIRASISIAPGATGSDWVGAVGRPGAGELALNILAVYFVDGSGEGDERLVQEFRDTDAGCEMLVRLVRPMVHELAARSDEETLEAVGELALRIRDISEPPEVRRSPAMRAGFLDSREMAAMEIEGFAAAYKRGGGSLFREKLAEAERRYEKQWHHLTSVRDAVKRVTVGR
jgi:hypothetical protein